tara:strand:+ start:285 stop:905 length:621 start_codon:yes stop_codon:yes gene_type:complete
MHRKIAAVGDSHSLRCFENHAHIADSQAYFGYNKLDGKTAYKLNEHDRRVRKIITPIKDKHLIFSFGEVDVRIHIKLKHVQTGIPVKTLISNTANRYTDYIVKLRNEGFDIHLFNIIPTGDFEGVEFENWKNNLVYPFTTSYAERQHYTLSLNNQYRKNCAVKRIPFIDIYDHLVDESGKRKEELIYDFSHLNSKTADILLAHYTF